MKGLTPICPYCGQFSRKVGGDAIYPHRPDLYHKTFYQCAPCDAHVGTHPGTDKPLGRLANAELREWKQRTHAAFDPIWKDRYLRKSAADPDYKKGMARGGRYKRLAELMGIDKEDCHIGMFDVAACQLAIQICESGALHD
ncbi:zinc-finger-containing protein [Halomonas salifodinae]|uniref:Zinc-finger-containing protein n=1 Tax=Halomonas salifodinae TaxID=438745 RepID=A0ABW2EYH9_9GAMM